MHSFKETFLKKKSEGQVIGLQNGSLNKELQFAFVMLKTLLLFSLENNIVHIYWVKCGGLILYI